MIKSQNPQDSSGNPALEGALAAASRGLQVFPVHAPVFDTDGQLQGCSCHQQQGCQNVGKHARVKDYAKLATTDQDRIRNWARKWPGTNFGILMSGTFGVDPDPRHGGDLSLKRLEGQHSPLPDTFTIRSGSGGMNRIYLQPDGVAIRNSASVVAEGVDIRGEASSGLFVAPGSMHYSGNRYELVQDMDPQPAPDWLVGLAQQVSERPREIPDVIPNGERDDTLTSLAGTLRNRDLTADEMLASLLAVNRRCEDPLPDEQVEKIARSVERYPPDEKSRTGKSLIQRVAARVNQ